MDDLNQSTNRLRRKFDPTSNYLETKGTNRASHGQRSSRQPSDDEGQLRDPGGMDCFAGKAENERRAELRLFEAHKLYRMITP
jgi:hypothetical protein